MCIQQINTIDTYTYIYRQASFIWPLMAEQRRHILCVGNGWNWTHTAQVKGLDPAFALTTRLRGRYTYTYIYIHIHTDTSYYNEYTQYIIHTDTCKNTQIYTDKMLYQYLFNICMMYVSYDINMYLNAYVCIYTYVYVFICVCFRASQLQENKFLWVHTKSHTHTKIGFQQSTIHLYRTQSPACICICDSMSHWANVTVLTWWKRRIYIKFCTYTQYIQIHSYTFIYIQILHDTYSYIDCDDRPRNQCWERGLRWCCCSARLHGALLPTQINSDGLGAGLPCTKCSLKAYWLHPYYGALRRMLRALVSQAWDVSRVGPWSREKKCLAADWRLPMGALK
jgi:hypothetical protein